MSSWIFDPTALPGFKRLHRQPLQKTVVDGIDSGKEARVGKYVTQRWRYEPEFELLRSSSTFLELQKIIGFFTRHGGRRDNFLLLDPEDQSPPASQGSADHGFAVGDGVTTSFQLQRTLLAGTLTQDALGSWDTYTKPRRNYLLRSQEFDNAAWAKIGTASVTPNTAIAPDGTVTADTLTLAAVNDFLSQSLTSTFAAGVSWTFSIWLKGTAGQTTTLEIDTTGGVYEQFLAPITLSGAWQRVSVSGVLANSGHTSLNVYVLRNAGQTASSIVIWGAQLEVGSAASAYIATTTASVLAVPLYWPSFGDGFEPVLDPSFASITILKDGVAQAVPSAWTPGAGGTVVFASAPAAGAVLSWTGSFYRRVRIDDDEPRFEQIMPGRYRGPFEMVSVI